MDVAAAHVEHAAQVLIAIDDFTNALLVHQFQLGMAEALPQAFLRFQVAHLLGGQGSEYATVFQVALDVVLGHALTDDAPALESHVAEQLCLFRADGAFDDIDVAAITVDDLATVAARSAETDFGGFQHGHTKARFQQEQGAGQAGVAGADHADIGLNLFLQRRARRNRIGRCGVVGLRVGGIGHAAKPLFYIFYDCTDAINNNKHPLVVC
ncbi:hypothetical protein D3C72_1547780 [compost metagenome]